MRPHPQHIPREWILSHSLMILILLLPQPLLVISAFLMVVFSIITSITSNRIQLLLSNHNNSFNANLFIRFHSNHHSKSITLQIQHLNPKVLTYALLSSSLPQQLWLHEWDSHPYSNRLITIKPSSKATWKKKPSINELHYETLPRNVTLIIVVMTKHTFRASTPTHSLPGSFESRPLDYLFWFPLLGEW